MVSHGSVIIIRDQIILVTLLPFFLTCNVYSILQADRQVRRSLA